MHITPGKVKIKENIDLFKCPICGDGMVLDNFKSIVCSNNHCFDLSKRGYVNLLLKPSKSQYDKALFQSRNIIGKMGFFDPLLETIVNIIDRNISNVSAGGIKILDAGCGEGYHLSQILEKLQQKRNVPVHGVGIDISKEGIQIASKNYQDAIWCVADLAKIPFMDKKFDIVLNNLSPSNYREFARVIGREGILVKVVPGTNYLQELRRAFYQQTDKEQYSNSPVLEHFDRNFKVIAVQELSYIVAVSKEILIHLIKMTPLSWGVAEEKIQRVLNQGIDRITAHFSIMIGKSKF